MNMRDTADLREMLLKDLDGLRAGEIAVSDARARAALAKTIVDTLKVELDAASAGSQTFVPVMLSRKREIRAAA